MPNFTTESIITEMVAPSIFGVIVVFGFFGNLLVILVVSINKQLRNGTNILIASLAIADITFITFCVPLTATIFIKKGWFLGSIACKIYQFFTYLTAYMSVYTLVLMSVDRYLAVVHPIASIPIRTEKNVLKIVLSTWVIFMLCNCPLLFNSGVAYPPTSINDTKDFYCTYMPTVRYNETLMGYLENGQFGRVYILLFSIFAYLLPLSAIILLYTCLIWKLLFNSESRISQSDKALQSKKRVTRMVVIVVVIFALCWMPIQIVFIIQFLGSEPDNAAFKAFHVFASALAYSNSMMNPILYAFFSNNFRVAFKSVLFCQKQSFSGRDFEKTNLNINRNLSEQRASRKALTKKDCEVNIYSDNKNNKILSSSGYTNLSKL
uniref:GCR032 n=1 Tax=Schmidtea mediterranea TaxID=79327 RepID=A0A193KUH5_SCHMD|nr:GCR032 [Schmidtea mediterranea]